YLTACGHGIQPFDDHKIIIIDYNDSKTTNRTTTSSDVIKSSDEVLVSFQAKGLTDSFFRDCAKCRRIRTVTVYGVLFECELTLSKLLLSITTTTFQLLKTKLVNYSAINDNGEFIGQNYKDDKITNMVENIIRTYGLEIMR
ncbi:15506_t:CDS:2, partial [Entrophospora sp. SA101]